MMKKLALFGMCAALPILGTTQAAELKVGDKAPAFELPGTDGKTYKLSDFKGKKTVVVAWYPKAKTRG